MIVVFGSINLDLIFPLPRLPEAGQTVVTRTGLVHPGGKGANQAVAAARDGAPVAFAAAVGSDALAEPALAGLVAAGVDVARVRRVPGQTGCSSITVDGRGGHHIAVAANANLLASATQVEDALLRPDTVLLLQMETDPLETAMLIGRARRRGARIILNLAPAVPLPAEALRAVDYLVVGQDEAAWLGHRLATGGNAASLHAALGVGVIWSLSTEGVEAVTEAGRLRVGAHDVKLIDTTAAGDCLAGVLAAGLDRGLALEPALRRANAAAAISCTRVGTQVSLPTAAETEQLLHEASRAAAL